MHWQQKGRNFAKELRQIERRYQEIIDGLELKLSLEKEFSLIRENFADKAGKDYAASRGEYLNGIIMANYLGYEFVDAAEVIVFCEDGSFDMEKTTEVLGERLKEMKNAVIPGFLRCICRTGRSSPFQEVVPILPVLWLLLPFHADHL